MKIADFSSPSSVLLWWTLACLLSYPALSVADSGAKATGVASLRKLLKDESLDNLLQCLQMKKTYASIGKDKLKSYIRKGFLQLEAFRMTGFGVGRYCGARYTKNSRNLKSYEKFKVGVQLYKRCLQNRKMVCYFQRSAVRCFKLQAEFLFLAFSDGIPMQGKMKRPFVCKGPDYSFFDKQRPNTPKACANGSRIANWKGGNEQFLLGLLRGCTLEGLFRQSWGNQLAFRQKVLVNKKVGPEYRGGQVKLNLRFLPLPKLEIKKSKSKERLYTSPFLRPLDIYGIHLKSVQIPTLLENPCKKSCCP